MKKAFGLTTPRSDPIVGHVRLSESEGHLAKLSSSPYRKGYTAKISGSGITNHENGRGALGPSALHFNSYTSTLYQPSSKRQKLQGVIGNSGPGCDRGNLAFSKPLFRASLSPARGPMTFTPHDQLNLDGRPALQRRLDTCSSPELRSSLKLSSWPLHDRMELSRGAPSPIAKPTGFLSPHAYPRKALPYAHPLQPGDESFMPGKSSQIPFLRPASISRPSISSQSAIKDHRTSRQLLTGTGRKGSLRTSRFHPSSRARFPHQFPAAATPVNKPSTSDIPPFQDDWLMYRASKDTRGFSSQVQTPSAQRLKVVKTRTVLGSPYSVKDPPIAAHMR